MNRFFRNAALIFSVAGPSIITTIAGNDGAGLVVYSLAGAQFGFGLLFLLPLLTLIYGLTQEVGSRLAIVTGRGMADLIRERYGVRVAVFIFVLFFIANVGTLTTNAAAVKLSLQLFGLHGISLVIALLGIAAFIFLMTTKLDSKTNQKIFLTSLFLYTAYIVSALRSSPNWAQAFRSLLIPQLHILTPDAILVSVAFVGTTITPWGLFFIQSYMKDKKLPIEHIGISRIEAYLGTFFSNSYTFFIIIATQATLYVHSIALVSGQQAALAIRPLAGELAPILYGLGLLNAGVIGLIIVGLATSYAFTEFFGFEGTLDVGYTKGKNFYRIFLLQILIAVMIVLIPSVSAFAIANTTQSFNAFLLPFLFYFLIKMASDRGLMREYTINPIQKFLLTAVAYLIVAASLFSLIYFLFTRFST